MFRSLESEQNAARIGSICLDHWSPSKMLELDQSLLHLITRVQAKARIGSIFCSNINFDPRRSSDRDLSCLGLPKKKQSLIIPVLNRCSWSCNT